MTRKVFQLSIELNIHAITCPGVWLCPNNGKVTLCMYMFDTWGETSLINPIFPLLIHEKFKFKKDIKNARSLADIQSALNDEYLYCELIQWSEVTTGSGTILSNFKTCLSNLLYPTDCNKKLVSGVDIELLMEPCPSFPGIIAPKIEVATRTTIKETMSKCKKKCPTFIVNPKVIRSAHCGRQEKLKRQRGVCHSDRNDRKYINQSKSSCMINRKSNWRKQRCVNSVEDNNNNNNYEPKFTCDYYKNQRLSPTFQSIPSAVPKCLCDLSKKVYCPICDKYQQYFNEVTNMALKKERNSSDDDYSRTSSPRHTFGERYQYNARLLHEKVDSVLNESKQRLTKSTDNINDNIQYDPKEYTVENNECKRESKRLPIHPSKYCDKTPANHCDQKTPPYRSYKPRPFTTSTVENRKLNSNEIQRPKSGNNCQKQENITNRKYTGKTLIPSLKINRPNINYSNYTNQNCTSQICPSLDLSPTEVNPPRKLKVRSKYCLEMYKPKIRKKLCPRTRPFNDKSNTNFRLNKLAVKPSIKLSKKRINFNKTNDMENYLHKRRLMKKTYLPCKIKRSSLQIRHESQMDKNELKSRKNVNKYCTQNLNVNKNVSLKKNTSKANHCVDHLIIVERPSIVKLVDEKLKTGELRIYKSTKTPHNSVEDIPDKNISLSIHEKNFPNISDTKSYIKQFNPKRITQLPTRKHQILYETDTFQMKHPFRRIIVNRVTTDRFDSNKPKEAKNIETCDDNTCNYRTSIDSMIDNLDALIKEKEIELNKEPSFPVEPSSSIKPSTPVKRSLCVEPNLPVLESSAKNLTVIKDPDDYIQNSSIASIIENISQMIKERETLCNQKECMCEKYRNEKFNASDTSYDEKNDTSKQLQEIGVNLIPKSTEDSSYPSKITTTDDGYAFCKNNIQKKSIAIGTDTKKYKLIQSLTSDDSCERNYYLNIKKLSDALLQTIDCTKRSREVGFKQSTLKTNDCNKRNKEVNCKKSPIQKIDYPKRDVNYMKSPLQSCMKSKLHREMLAEHFSDVIQNDLKAAVQQQCCQKHVTKQQEVYQLRPQCKLQCINNQKTLRDIAEETENAGDLIFKNPHEDSFSVYNFSDETLEQLRCRPLTVNQKLSMRSERSSCMQYDCRTSYEQRLNKYADKKFIYNCLNSDVQANTSQPSLDNLRQVNADHSLPCISKQSDLYSHYENDELMINDSDGNLPSSNYHTINSEEYTEFQSSNTDDEYRRSSETFLNNVELDSETIDQQIIESEIKMKALIDNDIRKYYIRKKNFENKRRLFNFNQHPKALDKKLRAELLQKIHQRMKEFTTDESQEVYSSEENLKFIARTPPITSLHPPSSYGVKVNFYDNYRRKFYQNLENFYKALYIRAQNRAERERILNGESDECDECTCYS